MIDPAFAAWDLLWRDLGQTFYAPTGTLALTGNGADWAERSARTLAAIGRPMTELSIDELRRRFPLLDARGVEHAFWIDTGGVLFAQDIVAALARHLANRPRRDACIRTPPFARSTSSTAASSPHDWRDARRRHRVVAAGAWVGRLLPEFARTLVPSRQVVIYFRLPEEQRAAWAKGPMVIQKTGDVGLYFVPPMQGRGFKVGDHAFSRSGDPDAGREAHEDEIRPLIERCRGLFKGFDAWRTDRREGLLLYRDRGRALRGREDRREGLGDVALLRPRLQVRRADGPGARAHHCNEPRPRCTRPLGGRPGKR